MPNPDVYRVSVDTAVQVHDGSRWRPVVSIEYRPVVFDQAPGLTMRALVVVLGGPGPDYTYVYPLANLPPIRWEVT